MYCRYAALRLCHELEGSRRRGLQCGVQLWWKHSVQCWRRWTGQTKTLLKPNQYSKYIINKITQKKELVSLVVWVSSNSWWVRCLTSISLSTYELGVLYVQTWIQAWFMSFYQWEIFFPLQTGQIGCVCYLWTYTLTGPLFLFLCAVHPMEHPSMWSKAVRAGPAPGLYRALCLVGVQRLQTGTTHTLQTVTIPTTPRLNIKSSAHFMIDVFMMH